MCTPVDAVRQRDSSADAAFAADGLGQISKAIYTSYLEQGWSCTVCKACTEDGDFARECILQAVLGGAIEAGMQASEDFSSSVIDLCAVIAALYACSKRPILNNYFTV